jgi:pilus assembly protein CpaF
MAGRDELEPKEPNGIKLMKKYPFFNRMVADIQQFCKDKEVDVPRWQRPEAEVRVEEEAFKVQVLRALREMADKYPVGEKERDDVAGEVAKRIKQLGVLQPFVDQDDVEEVIVRNGYVQVERIGRIMDVGKLDGIGDDYFTRLARRIADLQGRALSAESPQIKVGLPDGNRFTATIAPISQQGTAINIRCFGRKRLEFDDLIKAKSVDQRTVEWLTRLAKQNEVSVLFAGRPGAGKTTWLNAFCKEIPTQFQLSCIETFREIQPRGRDQPYHHLVVGEDPQEMGEAIKTTILRMRPDVLVSGEVVSAEAVEYILSLNQGIPSHTTIHGESAKLSLLRLENLSRQSEFPWQQRREIIANTLRLVVYLDKEWDGEKYNRRMRELVWVQGVSGSYEAPEYRMETLQEWDPEKQRFTPLKELPRER